jgi:guanylate kinase
MNQLHQLDEFQSALTGYELSPAARQTLAAVKLALLLGPTGGGRNTIINELVKTYDYYFIVSDTTRQPRSNNGVLEQNGREYWFRDEAEMLHEIQTGSFLEAEIIHGQQVSGISIRELARALQEGKTAVADADIGGLKNTLELKPDTAAVLILPPSFAEWQHRLSLRGKMPKDELRRRLQTATRVFKVGLEDKRFHLVVNDDFTAAAERIHRLVEGGQPSQAERTVLESHCQQLLKDTNEYLGKP